MLKDIRDKNTSVYVTDYEESSKITSEIKIKVLKLYL